MIGLRGKETVRLIDPEDEMDKIHYGIIMIIDIGITIHGEVDEEELKKSVEEITTNVAGEEQWCDADMILTDKSYHGRVRVFESLEGLLRYQDDHKREES